MENDTEHIILLTQIPSDRREWQHILSLMSLARRHVGIPSSDNILEAFLKSLVEEMKIFKGLDESGTLRKRQPDGLYRMDEADRIRFMYIRALLSSLTLILPSPTTPTLPVRAEELYPYMRGHNPEFLLFSTAVENLEAKIAGEIPQRSAELMHSVLEGYVHGEII